MVMSWLINYMINEIRENFLFSGTAKEIWDVAKETYSNSKNTSKLFSIKSILHKLRHGDSSITQYFNSLRCQWQQLDQFKVHKWKFPEDEVLYKQIIKKCVFALLMGLNKDLNEVHGRILGTKSLPNVREAF